MPTYKINGKEYTVNVNAIEGTTATVNVNGIDYTVELPAANASAVAHPTVQPAVSAPVASAPVASAPHPAAASGAGTVTAPLPGTVLSINCKIGDTVKASDAVIILEAMKMENAINAGRDGKVTDIRVKQGDSVLEGDVLLTIA